MLSIRLCTVFLALCAWFGSPRDASAAKATWVAGNGNDTGACTAANPCASFAYAAGQTDAGGTISVRSSGSFGPIAITKALAIVSEGAEALISGTGPCPGGVGGVAAVCVRAGSEDVVTLRGIHIDGAGGTGVSLVSAAALHIQHSVIRNGSRGLSFTPRTETILFMADTVVSECSSSAILIEPIAAGSAKATLSRVTSTNNSFALTINGNSGTGVVDALLGDSIISANGSGIFVTNPDGGGTVRVMVDRSAIANNRGKGISAASTAATIYVGDSTISGNGIGLATSGGGAIVSYRTNKIIANRIDGAPSATAEYR
jgi:hypothetical protein